MCGKVHRRYRGTSLIKNNPCLGSYSRLKPKALWWSFGGALFLMREVPLYLRYRSDFPRPGPGSAYRGTSLIRNSPPP